MLRTWNWGARLMGAIVLGMAVQSGPVSADKPQTIEDGMAVTLDYTLTLPDNSVADSTEQEPLSYVHGAHQIIPGLEKGLAGMKPGEKKLITVPADQAYGPYDEKNKVSIPKDKVPDNVKVGSLLRSRDGGPPVRVLEVNDKTVVIDTNHPLAGKDLRFTVKIISVEPAPKATEGAKIPKSQ